MTNTRSYEISDCCVRTEILCEPDLILREGDIDPFDGDEIGWPSPRVYWANGTITEGTVNIVVDERYQGEL